MSLRLGTKLSGRYRLVHPIARGGMGQVYEAVDEKLGRRVAVKVLLDELARDPTCQERFRREAHAVASTTHPSLVAIYDLSLDVSPVYLVMELLEGPSISHLLSSEGRIAWPRLLRWMVQVLDALQCLHDGGITHRDLKPANILVLGRGDRELAKVIDLGVAQLATGSVYQRLTSSGAIVGTPAFMAPEQLSGERVGPAADLWAVGTLTYTCLTGQRPYAARDLARLLESMHGSPPPPIRELAPDVPESVQQLVSQLLAKHPEDRPPSARAAADAMRAALAGTPSLSESGSAFDSGAIDPPSVRHVRSNLPTPSASALPPIEARQVAFGDRTRAMLGVNAKTVRASAWAAALAGLGILTTCGVGLALGALFLLPGRSLEPTPSASAPAGMPGMPTPRQLDVVHSGPDADAARSALAPLIDPRLRSCVDISRHGLGVPVASYNIYLDAYGAPTGLHRISGAGTEEEYACIEATLMSSHWPPPSTEYRDATVILMPSF